MNTESNTAKAGRSFKRLTNILLVGLPLALTLTITYNIGYNNGQEEVYETAHKNALELALSRGHNMEEAQHWADWFIYLVNE